MPKLPFVQWIIAIALVVIALELAVVVGRVGMFDGPEPDDWPDVNSQGVLDPSKIPHHSNCKTTYQLLQYMACAQETSLKLLNARLPK